MAIGFPEGEGGWWKTFSGHRSRMIGDNLMVEWRPFSLVTDWWPFGGNLVTIYYLVTVWCPIDGDSRSVTGGR